MIDTAWSIFTRIREVPCAAASFNHSTAPSPMPGTLFSPPCRAVVPDAAPRPGAAGQVRCRSQGCPLGRADSEDAHPHRFAPPVGAAQRRIRPGRDHRGAHRDLLGLGR